MSKFKNNSKVESDKKKSWFGRHKVLTTILVLVLLGIAINAGGGKKDAATTNPSSPSPSAAASPASKEAKATLAKIGVPARDGKFEFVVKSVDCGKATVGDNPYLQQTASGQYCVLNVSVKNIGDKAQSLFGDNQKLENAAGQEYSYDSTATIYNSSQSSKSWYSDINPGVTVEGAFVFDIPKDQTPVTAVLHDSAASNGVKVSLQ